MAPQELEIARRAFATTEWASAAAALFAATGISVSILDFESGETLYGATPCAYCYVATGTDSGGPDSCLDSFPGPSSGQGRVICRAGLPALYAPVLSQERVVAHVMVGGFVTSTRERRGRYERLLSRGVGEDAARRAIKTLPVITRAQAEAYLTMAAASATTVYAATLERIRAAERVEELRLFVSAGHNVVSASHLDGQTLEDLTSEAVLLAGAAEGALLSLRAGGLEVIAKTAGWRGSLGAVVPTESTIAGKAMSGRRVVMSAARPDGFAAMAVPLNVAERCVGVFELRVSHDAIPVSPDRLTRLARFAQFVAIALERESERAAVQRAMHGYTQLNALASVLGGQTDVCGVSRLLVREIAGAFHFDVAGVVLSGWGSDRADIAVESSVSRADLDHLLAIASGRDVASDPFEVLEIVAGGDLIGASHEVQGWSLSAVEMSHGDLNVGWLFVARCDGGTYSAQDRALLEGFSAHGGPAFGRAALFSRVRDDYAATIEALSATLASRERGTPAHAGKVMEYAVLMGEQLGLGVEAVERLRFAGILHDTGKAGIPGQITLTPTSLTPAELLVAHSRVDAAPSIVDQIEFLDSLTPIVMHHHENWDGSGYPHGLAGEEIPHLARILRVADAYDALSTSRPGVRKLSLAQSRKQLLSGAGTLFDPKVVDALCAVLDSQVARAASGLMAKTGAANQPELLA